MTKSQLAADEVDDWHQNQRLDEYRTEGHDHGHGKRQHDSYAIRWRSHNVLVKVRSRKACFNSSRARESKTPVADRQSWLSTTGARRISKHKMFAVSHSREDPKRESRL